MASGQTSQHLKSRLLLQLLDHDPGATTAKLAAPDGGTTPYVVDMSLYSKFLVGVVPTAGTTPSVTKLEIVASAVAAMTNAEVIKDSGAIEADAALVDYAFEECTAEEVGDVGARTGKELRYVAARITQAGNADNEAIVLYLAEPRFPRGALSANNISA